MSTGPQAKKAKHEQELSRDAQREEAKREDTPATVLDLTASDDDGDNDIRDEAAFAAAGAATMDLDRDRQLLPGEGEEDNRGHALAWPARRGPMQLDLPPGLQQYDRGRPAERQLREPQLQGPPRDFSLAPSTGTAVTLNITDLDAKFKSLELTLRSSVDGMADKIADQVAQRMDGRVDNLEKRVQNLEDKTLGEPEIIALIRAHTPPPVGQDRQPTGSNARPSKQSDADAAFYDRRVIVRGWTTAYHRDDVLAKLRSLIEDLHTIIAADEVTDCICKQLRATSAVVQFRTADAAHRFRNHIHEHPPVWHDEVIKAVKDKPAVDRVRNGKLWAAKEWLRTQGGFAEAEVCWFEKIVWQGQTKLFRVGRDHNEYEFFGPAQAHETALRNHLHRG
mmetsp:Transcript_65025/g.121127  ORF Transcript_65025/g.121127 Transcript_65025/m.121127 type:complete len:393 (+) Transcript_65025:217-1395(+)